MSTVFTHANDDIIDALWRLIAPNNEGEGGIEGGVTSRAILTAMVEDFPPAASGTSKGELADLELILRALIERGDVIERSPGHYDLPLPDLRARYTIEIGAKGSPWRFALRGTPSHPSTDDGDQFDAETAACVVGDMLGFRPDYMARTKIAPIPVDTTQRIGKATAPPLRFLITRVM